MKVGLVFLLALILWGCDTRPEKIASTEEYFNLEALLNQEIEFLISKEAGLEKIVVSNSKEDRIQIQPVTKDEWESQLSLFLDANIARPGLRGAYYEESLTIQEGISRTIYTAKNTKVAVQTFECLYQNEILNQINITIREKNSIFTSTKDLVLYFNSTGDHIIGFDVIGEEKMQLKEDLHFKIKAVITY